MTKQEFLRLAHLYPVAAAIKSSEDMQVALDSQALLLFILRGDAFQLAPFVAQAHKRGKIFFWSQHEWTSRKREGRGQMASIPHCALKSTVISTATNENGRDRSPSHFA